MEIAFKTNKKIYNKMEQWAKNQGMSVERMIKVLILNNMVWTQVITYKELVEELEDGRNK